MTYKQVVDSCTDGNKGWTVDERCEADVWVLVVQVLVTMVGVMSVIAEVEGIIGRMRTKRVEGNSIDEKATGGRRAWVEWSFFGKFDFLGNVCVF